MSWLDDSNLWYVVIPFLLGILASVIMGNYFRQKNVDDHKENSRKQLQSQIEILKARDRVKEKGGDYLLRDDDKVVSRHTKSFTIGASIVIKDNNEIPKDDGSEVKA